ncbi:unnamed protein product, partial [Mesorhabditis belari]|uniref:Nucleotide-diphospho-sugar transferase domain-containing protein n=1 Tax=Mesorhabditis belari TaxID=2138241 RepID=A0AAF3F5A9_9BILA
MGRKSEHYYSSNPFWYLWRNKWLLIVGIWCSVNLILDYLFVTPNFPRWARQKRLIRNVDKYSHLIPLESIENSTAFSVFAKRLEAMNEPPYIIFFDKTNIDVTKNHICNLKVMPGALERLAAVAFDQEAEEALNRHDPSIPTVTVDFTHVRAVVPSDLENKKYVTYQLILMLRARIVIALAKRGLNFWAMQQDSIWTSNFAMMDIENTYPDAHLLFDTVGNDQFPIYENMKNWICGSTFYVKGNHVNVEFFQQVVNLMRFRQSPDSSIMTYLCGLNRFKCVTLPKALISNSNFFMGNRSPISVVIQVDHESPLPKMELFRKWNLDFTSKKTKCDMKVLDDIRESVTLALPEVRQVPPPAKTSYYSQLKLR